MQSLARVVVKSLTGRSSLLAPLVSARTPGVRSGAQARVAREQQRKGGEACCPVAAVPGPAGAPDGRCTTRAAPWEAQGLRFARWQAGQGWARSLVAAQARPQPPSMPEQQLRLSVARRRTPPAAR